MRDTKMSKYVVFGAGNFGKLALQFYGEDKVQFFIDNDEKKIGSLYLGKRIVSFEDYMNSKDRFTIIVAVNNSDGIVKQLRKRHIQDFFVFKAEFFKIKKYFASNKIASIILYGIDDSTRGIIDILDQIGMKKRIKCIVQTKYDKYVVCNDIKYTSNLPVGEPGDCYMISKYKYHMALTALLEKSISKKFIFNPYYKREFYDTDTVVINSYEEKEEFKSEQSWNDDIKTKSLLREEIKEYVECSQGGIQLFKFIEIETINRCNGVCSFCPVNKNNDTRKETLMTKELFDKIICELADLNYDGHLCLFSNNEPLLDSRLVDFCSIARRKLPNAYLYLYTNGTLLSLEIFNKLICSLDELIIDNYSVQHSLIKPVRGLVESIKDNSELRKKVTVVIRDPNEILTSRGGEAPNREIVVSFNNDTCALPFRQMVVRPDGKVSLCCNDPLGRETMGDLNEQTLSDIWFGEKYTRVRELLAKGREHIVKCANCDTFYLF